MQHDATDFLGRRCGRNLSQETCLFLRMHLRRTGIILQNVAVAIFGGVSFAYVFLVGRKSGFFLRRILGTNYERMIRYETSENMDGVAPVRCIAALRLRREAGGCQRGDIPKGTELRLSDV